MSRKFWFSKALSMCLVVATMATYSMVGLANSERIAGELLVSGKSVNGQDPFVKVNGQAAQSGRSIFSDSTIATPENASAVINLGKAGKIELAPNSIMSLKFDEKGISGDLANGRVTVLNASDAVVVRTTDGKTAKLNAGESASSANGQTQTQTQGGQTQTRDDDDDGGGGGGFLLVALVLGGAAAGIILAARSDNNRVALGSSTTIVSPTR